MKVCKTPISELLYKKLLIKKHPKWKDKVDKNFNLASSASYHPSIQSKPYCMTIDVAVRK